jgi:hypothetical protein
MSPDHLVAQLSEKLLHIGAVLLRPHKVEILRLAVERDDQLQPMLRGLQRDPDPAGDPDNQTTVPRGINDLCCSSLNRL